MTQNQRLTCTISSGILLSLPWLETFPGTILLIAFVPLLFTEDFYASYKDKKTNGELFLYISLTFFIWNTASTWWIANASIAGAATAILLNTLLFSTVFWLYHITKRTAGNLIGSLSLVAYWTAFEYGYLNAEISWPWLNLGNGFAHDIRLIQWYEYTGTLGGTIWVLTVNLFIFDLVKKLLKPVRPSAMIRNIAETLLLIAIPITFSLVRFSSYEEKAAPCTVTVIQPNIDPYQVTSINEQCRTLIGLIDSSENKNVQYYLAPEAALDGPIWENSLQNNGWLKQIRKNMTRFPHAYMITGATTFKLYKTDERIPATARRSSTTDNFFSSFNSALQLDTSKNIKVYHKSKLVVGVEKMPYAETLKFLKPVVEKLGGSFASHGTQNYRSVFSTAGNNARIAPLICYESVYGEFVTGYIRNGANLIFILTNDGWWGNTPGYRQHLSFASLRAIETRRSIARSANTGISAFINQRGELVKTLGWGIRGSISATLNTNSKITFYTEHGDFLGKIAVWISAGICLLMLWHFLKSR
ncbi:MAG: apolipoprotein N-acyltransferase [Bacteroidota bacterium]|nr:apolipoprotein N-acyltransferase [Bacteroidota bacterium]